MDERQRLPFKIIMKKLAIVSLIIVSTLSLGVLFIFLKIPSEKKIRGCFKTEMYSVDLCPSSNQYIPLARISKYLQKAVVLTEDSSFFQHEGVDWESVEKSAKENLEKRAYKRGGSTITQQLAKNLFLSKDKTLTRKFFELLITMKIEKVLTKREILERYLNVIEFGKNIYGVKAASSFYFHKSPAELSIVDSAFLAAILPNPVKYSQSFLKKDLSPFLRKRITKIVHDLYQYQRITQEEYDIAMSEFHTYLNPRGQIDDLLGMPATLDDSGDSEVDFDETPLEQDDMIDTEEEPQEL